MREALMVLAFGFGIWNPRGLERDGKCYHHI